MINLKTLHRNQLIHVTRLAHHHLGSKLVAVHWLELELELQLAFVLVAVLVPPSALVELLHMPVRPVARLPLLGESPFG